MRVPPGGASCLGLGRPESGAPPAPTTSPFGCAAGGHYPLAVGGGCGRGDPSPTPLRALLRAGSARCGGGMRVPGGGTSCLGVGRPGSDALPSPTTRPFERVAGAHYQLAVGAGGAGVGTRHQPDSARSCELALRPAGAGRERPGGAPLAWVRGVRGRALTHPRPLVRSGVRPGPASHWPCVRCAGVGAWLSLAPSAVPRFVVFCARFPGSRHPVAVVAWHLSSCRGCGRRRASLVCLVAPRWCAAPRPVRSLSVRRSAFLLPWCLLRLRGLSPPALLGGCAGQVEAGRAVRPPSRTGCRTLQNGGLLEPAPKLGNGDLLIVGGSLERCDGHREGHVLVDPQVQVKIKLATSFALKHTSGGVARPSDKAKAMTVCPPGVWIACTHVCTHVAVLQ